VTTGSDAAKPVNTVHLDCNPNPDPNPENLPSKGKATTDARIMTKYFPQQFWHPIVDVDSGGTATVTMIGPNLIYMVASRTLSNQHELRSEVKTIKSCPAEPIRPRLTNTIRVD